MEVHASIDSTRLAQKIVDYLDLVGKAYDGNPEQKSTMLLTVMETWVAIDKIAIAFFPLLEDYEPPFTPTSFDGLQLLTLGDMKRLQDIRMYLQARQSRCSTFTISIFSNPTKGCFAERYYNESADSSRLGDLHRAIEQNAQEARASKEKEWQQMTMDYESLIKEVAQSHCLCPMDGHHTNCAKIVSQRKLERFKRRTIKVYEHPLPADNVEAKSVVSKFFSI